MNNQVLLIEQMQELIDMGIDTSSASCIWYNFADLGFALMFLNDGRESLTIEKMKENHGAENVIPAFTLQDILDILPQGFYLEKDTTSLDKKVFLQINKTAGGGYSIAYEQSWDEEGKLKIKMYGQQLKDSLLEAAFNMLKWVKQNNYI